MSKKTKTFLTLNEMLDLKTKSPKKKYLFSGVKEGSVGLIFGPSKSGKTIFCENLAMSLAFGAKEFFGYTLDGKERKVLFIGLEEFWENRAERNEKQLSVLSDDQQELVGKNYLVPPVDFTNRILNAQDWTELENLIVNSGVQVVFIDSITRMNQGKLENSADAEKLMQKLRDICQRTGVTLICIHHTPKMGENSITMDSIKGSSVFAQESDFAIAVTQTPKKKRYVKNIFFRYAPDDDKMVKEFEIDSSTWLNLIGDIEEDQLSRSKDRRRDDDKRDKIVGIVDQMGCKNIKTNDLVKQITDLIPIKERQAKTYISDLVDKGKIANPSQGVYYSIKCVGDHE